MSQFDGARGGSFNRNRDFSSHEVVKHKAICSDCKQDCEVPFKPIEGKPVYCKECYKNHRKF